MTIFVTVLKAIIMITNGYTEHVGFRPKQLKRSLWDFFFFFFFAIGSCYFFRSLFEWGLEPINRGHYNDRIH